MESKHIDNEIYDYQREKIGIKCGVIGIICNILLVILKGVIGFIMSSVSLIGDAINNLSDSLSSIINIFSFKFNNKPADKEHPYGHKKSEYIGGLLVSVLILFVSFELFSSSISKIFSGESLEITWWLWLILGANIIIKSFMAIIYKLAYLKTNSIVLKASYRDSFNDILTTLVIVIGLYLGDILNVNVDGYLGIALSIYILISGIKLVKESINKLMRDTIDDKMKEEIIDKVKINDYILGVHDVLSHKYGEGKAFMSIHAEMDASLTLLVAHEIVDEIERKIKNEYNIDFLIHIDPVDLSDNELKNIKDTISKIINEIDTSISCHDIRFSKEEERIYLDLEIPYSYVSKSKVLLDLVKNEIVRRLGHKVSIEINYK